MFDLNKLGDMAKIAGEAKALQEKQDKMAREQLELLKKISGQLDTLISIARGPKS
ncbi:MAG: hypothetical protein KTQ49_00930 [Candidatus Omnitrophica bacterium]|nr:hypothetical protein [Candidatus Omnitrophota bacterium]